MTHKQIARSFVCDPAIRSDAELAVSGLDKYPAFVKRLQTLPLDTLMFFNNHRALVSAIEQHLQAPTGALEVPNDDEATCGGLYNPARNVVAINTGYKNDSHVRKDTAMYALFSKFNTAVVAPQIAFTVPSAQVDTVLLIHELSHMIDFKHVRKNRPLAQFVYGEAAAAAGDSRRFVSQYASTQPLEWFAETMTAYVVHPEVLKDFDPLGFAAMRAALEL